MKKTQVAKRIEKYLFKYELDSDVRIYFNNKCWEYNGNGKRKVIENIKGSDYCEYGNDKTIIMTFEGSLYDILNYCHGSLCDEFEGLDFDNHYFEFGHAWSLSFYPNF
tara:strand:- start:126 stop:449 length:324 start_codon:yes stop_codon:yes gene_type:complete